MAYSLFDAFGVELEYMVVDRDTLAVAPVVDQLLLKGAGLKGAFVDAEEEDLAHPGSVELGPISWSNELALHVLEMKVSKPVESLVGLAGKFHESIKQANSVLAGMNAMLLPCGMHPLMDPYKEMVIWPHGYSEVYEAFNRIFDCKGHGWANLQSAHLNLPFQGDQEFGVLHAAIRYVLPILPALAASSPMMDGSATGLMDNRLEVYRHNARRVPIVSGGVIPEPVYTKDAYEKVIFGAIYEALTPHDPAGVLRHEWANSRGAIARFTRGAIEVRVLDVQECPKADLAVVGACAGAIRGAVEGKIGDVEAMKKWGADPLRAIFLDVVRDGERAVIRDREYLAGWGFTGSACEVRELWGHIAQRVIVNRPEYAESVPALHVILKEGCCARRMMKRLGVGGGSSGGGKEVDRGAVVELMRELAGCLAENRMLE